jgi:hypothetical protein
LYGVHRIDAIRGTGIRREKDGGGSTGRIDQTGGTQAIELGPAALSCPVSRRHIAFVWRMPYNRDWEVGNRRRKDGSGSAGRVN